MACVKIAVYCDFLFDRFVQKYERFVKPQKNSLTSRIEHSIILLR